MLRRVLITCYLLGLVVIGGGAYYDTKNYEDFTCPNPGTSQCWQPDQALLVLCSTLPEMSPCSSYNQFPALCPLQMERSKPDQFAKCFKASTSGGVQQETVVCYTEADCEWYAVENRCRRKFPFREPTVVRFKASNNPGPGCEESPPL